MTKMEYLSPVINIAYFASDIITESGTETDKDFELGGVPLE